MRYEIKGIAKYFKYVEKNNFRLVSQISCQSKMFFTAKL